VSFYSYVSQRVLKIFWTLQREYTAYIFRVTESVSAKIVRICVQITVGVKFGKTVDR